MPRTPAKHQAAEDLRNRATALASALEAAEEQNDKYRAALVSIMEVGSKLGDWEWAVMAIRVIARKALNL
jgi:hypothetical protein